MDPLFITVTHTGVFPDGRPNTNSVLITDLDTGLENQNRKTPVYVHTGSSISIPFTSRAAYSIQSGCLAKLKNEGIVDFLVQGIPIAGNAKSVMWGPDGDVQTWEEVMDFVNSSKAPVDIIPYSYGVPQEIPAGTYEMNHSRMVSPRYGEPSPNVVRALDGAVLRNFLSIQGAMVFESISSSPIFEYDVLGGYPISLFADANSVWVNNGTAPFIQVPDNEFSVISFRSGGQYPGNPSVPLIALGDNCICLIVINNGIQAIQDYVISGPVSSAIIVRHDGSFSFPIPPLTLFGGSMFNSPLGVNGGAGGTSFRPVPFVGPVSTGCQYFDLDLAPPRPIWWDGSQWIDASNTPVLFFMKEVELAAILVNYLRSDGWRVYQEVSVHGYGEAADIVAVKGKLSMIIEAKTSFSFNVLDQALRWSGWSHFIAVMVPGASPIQIRVADAFGIGIFGIETWTSPNQEPRIREITHGSFFRPKKNLQSKLLDSLCDANENGALAGSHGVSRSTPFSRTCERLVETVKLNPGLSVREALEKTRHHYSSIKTGTSSVSSLINSGVIRGIRLENGKLYPVT